MTSARLTVLVLLVAGLLLGAVAPLLAADIIYLVNGGRITGTIVEEGVDTIQIETAIGVQTIYYDDIERIERVQDPKAELAERAAALERRGSAQQWYELGLWAEERELEEGAERAFREAIARDPDHERARRKLGYRHFQGAWRTEDEVRERQGFVRYEGRWVRPEEKERLEQGFVEVDGEWVHRDVLEERRRKAEEGRQAARDAARPDRARRSEPDGVPEGQDGAGVVRVPPPPPGRPPSDERLAQLVEMQRQRAREAERIIGVEFEDVEEGPLLVHTTQAVDSDRFRSFLRELGQLYRAQARVYDIPDDARIWPGKLQIFFFSEKSEFDAFAARVDNAPGAAQSGGYFIVGEGGGRQMFHICMFNLDTGTLAHELSHAFMARYDYSQKQVAPWINEGVAEFLRLYCAEEYGLGRQDQRHRGVVREMLRREDPRMGLRAMMEKQRIAGTEGWAYAVSWSIIDFMIYADRRAFVRFLKRMKETDGTFSDRWTVASADAQTRAIEEAFGVSIDTFESRWKERVRDGR